MSGRRPLHPLRPTPAPRHQHRHAGFTLLEALLAIALLGMMFAVLLPTIRFAGQGWSTAEERIETAAAESQALGAVRRLIEQARPLPAVVADVDEQGFSFTGAPDALRFVAPLPAFRGGGGLQTIEIRQGQVGGIDGLVLDWAPYHPDFPLGDLPEGERLELILEDVDAVEFSYLARPEPGADPEWGPEWVGQPFPRLVHLRLFHGGELRGEVFASPRIDSPEEAGMPPPGELR